MSTTNTNMPGASFNASTISPIGIHKPEQGDFAHNCERSTSTSVFTDAVHMIEGAAFAYDQASTLLSPLLQSSQQSSSESPSEEKGIVPPHSPFNSVDLATPETPDYPKNVILPSGYGFVFHEVAHRSKVLHQCWLLVRADLTAEPTLYRPTFPKVYYCNEIEDFYCADQGYGFIPKINDQQVKMLVGSEDVAPLPETIVIRSVCQDYDSELTQFLLTIESNLPIYETNFAKFMHYLKSFCDKVCACFGWFRPSFRDLCMLITGFFTAVLVGRSAFGLTMEGNEEKIEDALEISDSSELPSAPRNEPPSQDDLLLSLFKQLKQIDARLERLERGPLETTSKALNASLVQSRAAIDSTNALNNTLSKGPTQETTGVKALKFFLSCAAAKSDLTKHVNGVLKDQSDPSKTFKHLLDMVRSVNCNYNTLNAGQSGLSSISDFFSSLSFNQYFESFKQVANNFVDISMEFFKGSIVSGATLNMVLVTVLGIGLTLFYKKFNTIKSLVFPQPVHHPPPPKVPTSEPEKVQPHSQRAKYKSNIYDGLGASLLDTDRKDTLITAAHMPRLLVMYPAADPAEGVIVFLVENSQHANEKVSRADLAKTVLKVIGTAGVQGRLKDGDFPVRLYTGKDKDLDKQITIVNANKYYHTIYKEMVRPLHEGVPAAKALEYKEFRDRSEQKTTASKKEERKEQHRPQQSDKTSERHKKNVVVDRNKKRDAKHKHREEFLDAHSSNFGTYMCSLCNFKTTSKARFQDHEDKKAHMFIKRDGCYCCRDCNMSFDDFFVAWAHHLSCEIVAEAVLQPVVPHSRSVDQRDAAEAQLKKLDEFKNLFRLEQAARARKQNLLEQQRLAEREKGSTVPGFVDVAVTSSEVAATLVNAPAVAQLKQLTVVSDELVDKLLVFERKLKKEGYTIPQTTVRPGPKGLAWTPDYYAGRWEALTQAFIKPKDSVEPHASTILKANQFVDFMNDNGTICKVGFGVGLAVEGQNHQMILTTKHGRTSKARTMVNTKLQETNLVPHKFVDARNCDIEVYATPGGVGLKEGSLIIPAIGQPVGVSFIRAGQTHIVNGVLAGHNDVKYSTTDGDESFGDMYADLQIHIPSISTYPGDSGAPILYDGKVIGVYRGSGSGSAGNQQKLLIATSLRRLFLRPQPLADSTEQAMPLNP